MIISVHLPKTAGKSFEAALRTRFGVALMEDYASLPMNTPKHERVRAAVEAGLCRSDAELAGVECIHGHFLPVTYLPLSMRRDVTFVTWMRDPVQRLLSHYHYWRRTYQPDASPRLHRKVVEEEWSVERFCLCDDMRNMYEQFLWGFPVDRFEFIGVTECYDEDLAYFARRYLSIDVEPQRLNVGDAPGSAYDIDPVLHRRIEAFHRQDVELYQRALQMRLRRPAAMDYSFRAK